MFFKKRLGIASSLSDVLLTGKFKRFDEIFELLRLSKAPFFQDIYTGVSSPGWLSALIHRGLSFLADEQTGLIPALRKHCKEKLAGYHQFSKAFIDLHSPEPEPVAVGTESANNDAESFYTMSTLSMENLTQNGTEPSTLPLEDSTVSKSQNDKEKPSSAPVCLTAEEDLMDAKKRRDILQMLRIFYKPVPAKDLNADEEVERPLSKDDGRPPLTPEIDMWEEV